MDFIIDCGCGKRVTVAARQAGGEVACSCGRVSPVPLLSELRKRAGLAAYEADPVAVIREALADGSLPVRGECLCCGASNPEVAYLIAQCEQTYRRGGEVSSGEWQLATILFGVWGLLAMLVLRGRPGDGEEFGRNTAVSVPLSLCGGCRGWPVSRFYLAVLRAVRWLLVVGGIVAFFWTFWAFLLPLGAAAVYFAERRLARTRQQALRELASKVPPYARLFESYPDAELST